MFKCYRQIEHSDCGLTCIRMIAKFYGASVPIRYLHSISDLNRLGMSIKDMTLCCQKIGLDSVAVQISAEQIENMPLPAILFWQQRHFVVLYKYNSKSKKYYIADPAQGKLTYLENDFCKYWIPEGQNTGLAVLIEPSEQFNATQFPKENNLKQFFCYLSQFFKIHQVKFIIALLITIGIMAADFAIPLLLKKTIDDGIGLKDINLVVLLLLGQLGVSIGGLVASSGMDLILTRTGLGIHIEMVNTFLERLSKFPLSFFDKKVSSDFVQKISDQSRIKDFLLTFPNTMFIMVLSIIVFSVLLFHYSVSIFFIFIFMSLLEVGWNTLFLNKRKTLDYAYFTNSSENRNHAYELTNGMADLKVNNAESSRISKWKATQKNINQLSMQSAWVSVAQSGGHSIIARIKDLLVTGVGATMVIYGDLTIGALMTLGYITGRLSQPFTTLGSSMSNLQDALLSYQRIDDVIHDDTELRGNEKFLEASVVFENVSFKYAGAGSPFVINDFNLTVEKGEVIALVGESGCGKSTLIKLMLGFYVPQKGILTLSGYNVRDIDNQEWLNHCGVVMQEAKIFSGSILENISLSENKPNLDKALYLLEIVGLKTFVESLPMNIYTKIGVAGIEMSGGQKQRLMIARALYKDPDLLFLDEATSSLDANNEKCIVSNINSIGKGKTIVIAAHRLSTVQDADKIVFIKDGRIAEMGTHSELVSLKGHYWKLVRNQLQLSV
ncbi:MAG: peptidase domain-containing ABC transporter [Muribaculaceae bacterium]|nr:peptidase domain-containing ABC transporter [Muribaculaceae bacterium]